MNPSRSQRAACLGLGGVQRLLPGRDGRGSHPTRRRIFLPLRHAVTQSARPRPDAHPALAPVGTAGQLGPVLRLKRADFGSGQTSRAVRCDGRTRPGGPFRRSGRGIERLFLRPRRQPAGIYQPYHRVTNPAFWTLLGELVVSSRVVIDRPRGSAHPRFPENIYLLDYGFLEGTTAGDGQGIDVWLGSGDHTWITGIVCTVDLDKRGAELKLLLGSTPAEAQVIMNFLNAYASSQCLLVPRP